MKLLCEATIEEIQSFADSLGYTLSGWDCEEIKNTSYNGNETIADAVHDYLNAYER
jgi:hypothetical protein